MRSKIKWNNEKALQAHREYCKRLRKAVFALLGDKCSRCGYSDYRALQIDHIYGGGQKEQIELGGPASICRKILKMEHPETEYQTLCANCNWIKRYENSEYRNAVKEN